MSHTPTPLPLRRRHLLAGSGTAVVRQPGLPPAGGAARVALHSALGILMGFIRT